MSGARVIAVAGACGGAGSTLLAGGLALALARGGRSPQLLDLDLEGGDLAPAWDSPDEPTVAALLPVAHEIGPAHLRRVRHDHPSGVAVTASPSAPGAAAAWTDEAVAAVVAAVRADGDAVIDLGSGLRGAGAAAALAADVLVIVAPPTFAAARGALRIRGAVAGRAVLVSTLGARAPQLGVAALASATGLPLTATLPASPREADELSCGRWPRARRAGLARAVADLAAAL